MTGYIASVTIVPEAQVGIVVLTNGDNASPTPIETAVRSRARATPPVADAAEPGAAAADAGPARPTRYLPQPAPLHGGGRAPGTTAWC